MYENDVLRRIFDPKEKLTGGRKESDNEEHHI
jgi:hypothetical protein